MEKDRRQNERFRLETPSSSEEASPSPAPSKPHRFISRDGRVNIRRKGLPLRQPQDWYHLFLTTNWLRLSLLAAAGYLVFNAFFALLYMLNPGGVSGARPHSFFDHFFFSVHVFSTLGFNQLNPASFYANMLVTVESFVGWCSLGLITGLLFSRFSRPSARVMFSHYAIIAAYEGTPTLIFRAANRRGNQILQAQINVTLARNERTLEDENVRRVYDLKLLRSTSSFFNLTWTIRHQIDASSPLFGETPESLKASETEITVLLSGIDDAFGQTVHGRFSYNYEEILFGYRFASLFGRDENGHPVIDFSRFDAVEEIEKKKEATGASPLFPDAKRAENFIE